LNGRRAGPELAWEREGYMVTNWATGSTRPARTPRARRPKG